MWQSTGNHTASAQRCWFCGHLSPFLLAIAADLQKQGLTCFYDNAQLVACVDIVFLCCLLSHVPSVCSVIQPAIAKPCVVHSFVTAIPLLR